MRIKIKENLKKLANFLKEVRLEMKKINWLSTKETLRYTLVVILVSVVVAIFLSGADFLFGKFLDKFIF